MLSFTFCVMVPPYARFFLHPLYLSDGADVHYPPTHTHTHKRVPGVRLLFVIEWAKKQIKESIIIETGLFFEAILY